MKERGWTFSETLVVVVVIGLLATIALPVFQGQRANAANGVTQANLMSAYRSAASNANEEWPEVETLIETLSRDEPTFTYRSYATGRSRGPKEISVSVNDPHMITMCARSTTRLVYCLRADELGTMVTDPMPIANGNIFLPHAWAADEPLDIARSTGASEASARAALPTREAEGQLTPRNARGWHHCVGACAQ